MAQRDNLIDLRKQTKKGEDKWGKLGAYSDKGTLTWEEAEPGILKAAIVSATEDGAALLLSKTSDGGALVIQVLSQNGRHKLYPATMAELNEALALITEIASQR